MGKQLKVENCIQQCNMAEKNNNEFCEEDQQNLQILYEKFVILNKDLLRFGVSIVDLKKVCFRRKKLDNAVKERQKSVRYSGVIVAITIVGVVLISILLKIVFDSLMKTTLGTRCLLPNNYFIWEATRPVTDCNMCKDVKNILIFENITREEFRNYAYSSRPMLVKGAALHWPAMHTFTYNFFKEIYQKTEGAFESVEEECQILTFKTEFKSLEDVFSMPESRVLQKNSEKPWYVGWSNCHPEVLSIMREHYSIPHFLPEDAEHANMDYIFIGYEQGAVMHIDYISRLMWQAQLRGHKTWKLVPPPDCDHVCTGFSFRVEPGDIVLVDTRQWYHDTHIDAGELSLTVSSEYG
ncbi:hypothetical protein L9F63_018129 [Diploptera punctata]|uniref:Cupin-like domain-containing protein n=1 Tax=Diploptera punctata TaxID=6984 RepID=A0AAD7ZZ65_DIPPU|nr:hypothetical protein L9F63_018129 [Diploptera punctata]